ncbi:hypothetical protein IWZ03DRAFT_361276 [Phyllosticta citriasiana]|uniref:Uncharacterized protein n=1 Tax=Phyllosticta citriasiana TaxID=595635 RepID=A0ABR1KJQ2_9PEZI
MADGKGGWDLGMFSAGVGACRGLVETLVSGRDGRRLLRSREVTGLGTVNAGCNTTEDRQMRTRQARGQTRRRLRRGEKADKGGRGNARSQDSREDSGAAWRRMRRRPTGYDTGGGGGGGGGGGDGDGGEG